MHRSSLVALALTLLCSGTARAQTCYSMPFPDALMTDPWGCAAACGRDSAHRGTDFGRAGVCGSGIPAIAAGVVIANERNSCLGNIVAIRHPDGLVSGYAHMRDPSPLPVGSSVSRGQIVGTAGETGASGTCVRGCHLHVTLGATDTSWRVGDTIDPVAYIHAHEAGVNCDEGAGALDYQAATYAPPTTTDVNGDGRADLCARASDGLHCWPAEDDGFGESWAPIPWDDAGTWGELDHFASIRMGDVNGDGLADACIRSNDAFHCALSNGAGFEPMTIWLEGMSDANGWRNAQYWMTIRLADVDGDGDDDLCARDAAAFGCWLSDGTRFDARIDGPGWGDGVGFAIPHYYGTLRMGDIDGDGRADVCIRGAAGMGCALSDGMGFPTAVTGPAWSDASGFTGARFWTTLRMGDVNGDGKGDLCIRTSADYRCAFSNGAGFDADVPVELLADGSGWEDRSNYETIRMGDINGDGAEDVCARGDAGLACWAWNGAGFDAISGPAWSDPSGWAASPYYYDTIRLADVDGDGLADACARGGAGFACTLATGTGFETVIDSGELTDAGGWANTSAYWSTILFAGRCEAEAETCNGRDDDCDGEIDDGTCIDAGPPDAGRADGAVAPGIDAGRPRGAIGSGCGCRTSAARGAPPLAFALTALAVVLGLRRRRRTN